MRSELKEKQNADMRLHLKAEQAKRNQASQRTLPDIDGRTDATQASFSQYGADDSSEKKAQLA